MPHSEQYDRRMHHELSTEHHDPLMLALGIAYWLVGKTSRLLTEPADAGNDVKALVPDD